MQALEEPSTANFAAQYASLKGWPTMPPTLLTVSTRPPDARRCGIAALVTRTTPKKFTSIASRNRPSSSSSTVPTAAAPALLTTASSRP